MTAQSRRERQSYYRVGSDFCPCDNCGSVQVFRAYQPVWVGWTFWCYDCGAKDKECWNHTSTAEQLGKPPVLKPKILKASRMASSVKLPKVNNGRTVRGEPRQCECECGGMTKGGRFLPGHDAKLHSRQLAEARAAANV